MHYYRFNIGDYKSHTSHLDLLEDLAYRRMLDYCYLNEIGLPKDINEIARLIGMRTHNECIANVLREFFFLDGDTYKNTRVEVELFSFSEKSEKAANSAKARWAKNKGISDANAMQTQCEGNANQEPRTKNQEPLLITSSEDDKRAKIPYQEISDKYNQICKSLPEVKLLSDKRKTAIKTIWNMNNKHQSLDFWEWYFNKIESSDFLTARSLWQTWKAGFDFITNKNNFVKVIEGNYDNK